MAEVFRRPQLAAELAGRLLRPGVLDEGLRSGLFLSGLRRTGKTTFLCTDLLPELEGRGAVVIDVDLWSDTKASPAALVQGALRQTLRLLATPRSPLLERLGEEGGATLAQALTEVVDQSDGDVVLIVDDAINHRLGTPGHFLFLGTGSHRALVSELTARRNQAFAGATSLPYPLLDQAYVRHVLDRLREDQLLPVIATTLRRSAADLELAKVEQIGGLATAIFDRVACSDGPARGIFSAEAAAAYGEAIGREVRVEEIQPVVNEL
ncbi:MAG: ATP-binding protein, partial [Cyanobacteriota bacterium]